MIQIQFPFYFSLTMSCSIRCTEELWEQAVLISAVTHVTLYLISQYNGLVSASLQLSYLQNLPVKFMAYLLLGQNKDNIREAELCFFSIASQFNQQLPGADPLNCGVHTLINQLSRLSKLLSYP